MAALSIGEQIPDNYWTSLPWTNPIRGTDVSRPVGLRYPSHRLLHLCIDRLRARRSASCGILHVL